MAAGIGNDVWSWASETEPTVSSARLAMALISTAGIMLAARKREERATQYDSAGIMVLAPKREERATQYETMLRPQQKLPNVERLIVANCGLGDQVDFRDARPCNVPDTPLPTGLLGGRSASAAFCNSVNVG